MVETNLNNNILFSNTSVKLKSEKSGYKDQGVQFFLKEWATGQTSIPINCYILCLSNEWVLYFYPHSNFGYQVLS